MSYEAFAVGGDDVWHIVIMFHMRRGSETERQQLGERFSRAEQNE